MTLLQNETTKLQRRLLSLAALVEDALTRAVRALSSRNRELAVAVIDGDATIDACEVELEEECLKVLALHQPVAQDLRAIVGLLKINSDLERIGDYGVSIAKRAAALAAKEEQPGALHPDFRPLLERALKSLSDAIDAFVRMDAAGAWRVRESESEFESARKAVTRDLTQNICQANEPAKVEAALEWLRVARSLERIVEHATGIAEDVIYIVEGVIVRHDHKGA